MPERPPAAVEATMPALADAVAGLVSPPHICMRVRELVEGDTASASDLGDVIAQDPSLAARLLRLANSSFYGLRRPVDTLSRAVSVVGGRELYGLTLAAWAVDAIATARGTGMDIDIFWRHSLFCGLLARLLGLRAGYPGAERLFVAGLLHDLGALALAHGAPALSGELHRLAGGSEPGLHALERERLGFTHGELGAELLARWRVPESITMAVRHHHEPAGAGPEAALVHLADAVANTSELSAYGEHAEPEPRALPGAWAEAGLEGVAVDAEALLGEAGLQFADITAGLGS